MFVVVEFTTKEVFVVPLVWIHDSQNCQWPPKCTNTSINKMVQALEIPKPEWTTHPIRKIHFTSENISDAKRIMDGIIGTVTTDHNEEDINNIKDSTEIFETENEEADETLQNLPETTLNDMASSSRTESKSSSIMSSRSPGAFAASKFCEKVFMSLEAISEDLAQNTYRTQGILRILSNNQMKHMAKPPGFPKLPFKKTRQYMPIIRNRLSTLGGNTIKHATTNMLKFLLSNRCARKYSWSGQKAKQSFQSLKSCKILIEAVYSIFESETPADLNDSTIKKAIQDWLRLANQRYAYETTKSKSSQSASA